MPRGGPNRSADPAHPARSDERRSASYRTEDRYQAASRYYVLGETMEAIAKHLMVSRSSVSRLLQEARDEGLVRITLSDHVGSACPAAVNLTEKFGTRVHVAPVRAGVTESARLEQVAKLAGSLLTAAVNDHHVIGVAWGRTIARVVQHVSRRPLVGATVVQLNGSADPRRLGTPNIGETFRALGDAFDAELVLFPLPAFFDQAVAKEMMWRERSVRQVLGVRERVDIAIFGVGGIDAQTSSEAYAAGYFSDGEVELLKANGVVGDVCTTMLREDGSYADILLNERATGPTPHELRLLPRRICVVADPSRAAAVLGALRAGVATDLVLDDETARAVIACAATYDHSGRERRDLASGVSRRLRSPA